MDINGGNNYGNPGRKSGTATN